MKTNKTHLKTGTVAWLREKLKNYDDESFVVVEGADGVYYDIDSLNNKFIIDGRVFSSPDALEVVCIDVIY